MPPSKVSPKKPASPPKKEPPPNGPKPCRFNTKAFARVFEIIAAFLLIVDVVLNHKHQVTMSTWAGCLLFAGMLCNIIALRCVYTGGAAGDEEHADAASAGWKANAIALVNVIALDGFLYEEAHYNYFGHGSNVLAEERLGGAFVEILIALYIFFMMAKAQTKDEFLVARYGMSVNMV